MMSAENKDKIDWLLVQEAARILCSKSEIAGLLRVTVRELTDQCEVDNQLPIDQYIERFSADGKKSIRRAQFKAVEGGSNQLLVHLGKTVLGQDGETNIAIEVGLDMFDENFAKAASAAFDDERLCSRCQTAMDDKVKVKETW